MNPIDGYVAQVLDRLPPDSEIRSQVEVEVRSHVAERMEHGEPVDAALKQMGDPAHLAESYLSSVPLVPASLERKATFMAVMAPAALPPMAMRPASMP